MSFWETLIGMAERSWKEKPRKDIIRQFVYLRTSMIDCQKSYEEYVALREQGDVDKLIEEQRRIAGATHTVRPENPRGKWRRSLDRVADAVERLDSVLSIFSPETTKAITSWHQGESDRLLKDLSDIGEAIGEPVGYDLATDTLDPAFKSALEKLDDFIEQNFKTEEVYGAERY